MALIRYPGSKAKLAKELFRVFPPEIHSLWSQKSGFEYREPFFGAGAVGFDVIKFLHSSCLVWLNDIDPGMEALWRSVQEYPIRLCSKILAFTPSAEKFYEYKQLDDKWHVDFVERGFIKLALHRMSFSGLGYRAGGPIGGASQASSEYDVHCRWNPDKMVNEVRKLHERMKYFNCKVKISCVDFEQIVRSAPETCFIYLDPPYYAKGAELYKFSMTHDDHVRLADALRNCKASWVLSYDDHDVIRDLYSWAKFIELRGRRAFDRMKYTIGNTKEVLNGGERPKNKEVAIVPA